MYFCRYISIYISIYIYDFTHDTHLFSENRITVSITLEPGHAKHFVVMKVCSFD